MKYGTYLAMASLLICIIFALMLYGILKKCRTSRAVLNGVDTLPKHVYSISNSRLHNSILCYLKVKLKEQLKDFCDRNNVECIKAESAQYGVLMVKVGFEYVQHQMACFISEIQNDDIYKKALLLGNVISQSENLIFAYSEYRYALIKCELQNILYARISLRNIFNLVKDIKVKDQIELMKTYHAKLDCGLAFIAKGLGFIMKDVGVLDEFDSIRELCDDGFLYDDDYLTFTSISLKSIEGYTH
ncbi:conserved hypothetical protein [Ehrlichia chaffeensis str. Arkansas]|uniref:Uncharacterized protein n=1 Tax=Ehrlichia chaffeensis (strain ATCC CRL-10679 / Arkansas) TaxID=205920 RepID=Q2GHI7_EHRCR|nr:hypothetical protein [Ehrlichia chaffeensis]ABD45519.1 conserved hypothetical protein [Ehrlichia chaffeensis str. Arkansas]AHX05886.1 hypothetical protein ECHJAX_0830 [Ehrlichia chaffeensis str. Jax]AHX08584.1 hypothetical protein ECHSTV_0820 [Ehrlichia chaffeensis str. Saint Vincent]AHX09371.1 hypothetical protein ECHWAK_0827 [Ehrlichia chaffeensis str. Wakulla]